MEISAIQVFVTAITFVGTGAVALMCDYLKNKNHQLREAMVELRARREEEMLRTEARPQRHHRVAPPETEVADQHSEAPASMPPAQPAPAPPAKKRSMSPAVEQVAAAVAAKNGLGVGAIRNKSTAPAADTTSTLVRKPNGAAKPPASRANVEYPKTDLASFEARRAAEQAEKAGRAAKKVSVPPPAELAAPPASQEPVAPPTPIASPASVAPPVSPAPIPSPVSAPPSRDREEPLPVAHIAPRPQAETFPKIIAQDPKDSLSEWLARRAAARAARIAQTPTQPVRTAESQPAPMPKPIEIQPPVVAAPPVQPEKQSEPELEVVIAAPAPKPSAFPPVEIDAFLWESLVSNKLVATTQPVTAAAPAPPPPQFEVMRGGNQLGIPAGMYDQSYLARLLEIGKPFSGLVVSIGISENDGSVPQNDDLMRSASLHIGGLLQEKDFGCRACADEFILVCPGLQGAEAQRRLSHISERLWDFQLRGPGNFSILFSTGGIDVHNEPLSEAIASASERMYQTKRSRKTVSMESVNQRRKAV